MCIRDSHLNEDHYFPEIVDPKTLEPVAPGETGITHAGILGIVVHLPYQRLKISLEKRQV